MFVLLAGYWCDFLRLHYFATIVNYADLLLMLEGCGMHLTGIATDVCHNKLFHKLGNLCGSRARHTVIVDKERFLRTFW